MNRMALINSGTGRCENVIVVDPGYIPPEGFEVQAPEGAAIGKIWNGRGYDPVPASDITDIEDAKIARSFPNGSPPHAMFGCMKEILNRIEVLEGIPPSSEAQILEWFKQKLRNSV